jgi:hypothetical protein
MVTPWCCRILRNAMFNNFPWQRVVMNLKTFGIFLLLILAVSVAFSGCTATTGPTPQRAVITPEPLTPLKTTTPITPLPVGEIARIKVDHFGMDPTTATVYEFVGKVQINNGMYQSVQVILRYPDSQEYSYDVGGMGGSNQTIKEFSLFPADRYKGTNPEKIISLDGKRYATAYRYENGLIAWVATTDNPLNK